MKTVLLTVLALLFVAVAAVLGYAATRPDEFGVQRSLRIKASPEKLAALVTDFHAWSTWSPYEKLDPAMQRSFSGAPRGRGAVYAWQSDGKAGAGRMEILEAAPARVVILLDFSKPFEAHNLAEFTFVPDGDATVATWTMHGPLPYVAKVVHVFLDMDKLVGKDFEAGLANLKAATEN